MLLAQVLQKAFFEALVETQTAPVLDHMPQRDDGSTTESDIYPLVVMSDHTAQAWDTDNSEGLEFVQTVDFWSRYVGNSELKAMMQAAYDGLHRHELSFEDSDLHCVLLVLQRDQVLVDPDGLTRHGIMEFKMLVERLSDAS